RSYRRVGRISSGVWMSKITHLMQKLGRPLIAAPSNLVNALRLAITIAIARIRRFEDRPLPLAEILILVRLIIASRPRDRMRAIFIEECAAFALAAPRQGAVGQRLSKDDRRAGGAGHRPHEGLEVLQLFPLFGEGEIALVATRHTTKT